MFSLSATAQFGFQLTSNRNYISGIESRGIAYASLRVVTNVFRFYSEKCIETCRNDGRYLARRSIFFL